MTFNPRLRQQAAEAIQRMEDIMNCIEETGVFGDHVPEGCLRCRAEQVMENLRELREKLQKQVTP
jgi:hypothetical protein